MKNPEISIIMPVYNAEEFLRETIRSVQEQTFGDFEVICVDDGSTDSSVAIITETAHSDGRFRLLQQKNAGAGAARNYGFTEARGEYAIFLDSDDLFSPQLLEKLHDAITAAEADIAACNFSKMWPDGRETRHEGVHTRWIPEGLTVFSYRDTPDYIMRVINPTPWNKLYRSAFIREKGLKYEEISSTNDITFAAVSVASAERVTYITDSLVRYRVGHSGTISSTKAKKLNNVTIAINSAVRQAKALPHSEMIHNSILSFVVDNYIVSLCNHIKDFSSPEAARFYQMVHEVYNQEEFADVDPRTLHNPKQYREFCTVRKHDYETMKRLINRRLIVSLTTYPKRIGTLGAVLESIYAQTRKADEVVLWLAEEQFPGKEKDLPEYLLQLVGEGKLTIRWCDDLKPHKKYFYALQEYTNDLVVTVDDDLLYPRDMLECLYRSYLQYPEAVSTVRAHLIMVSEQNEIMPYSTWIQETDSCIYQPSMQLLATGGAGCLYPPNLLRRELFDAQAIRENCLWADDLWLKVMELMSDVPVVLARPYEQLHYLPDSQEEALHRLNVGQNHNDVQLANVSRWLDEKYEKDILIKKLTTLDIGVKILGMEAVSCHINEERKALRRNWSQADNRIRQSDEKARQAQSKLQQADKKRVQAERKQAQAEKKAKQAEKRLKETEEKTVGGQYQEAARILWEQKQAKGISVSWFLKRCILVLAAILKKLYLFVISLVKDGFSHTMKLVIRKLLRRT